MTTNKPNISFNEVFDDEKNVIQQQRINRIDPKAAEKGTDTLVGLAISGGGIRSASFALGVLQALDKHNKLRSIDYLSTVSGGGYIGGSLTWFNYLNKKNGSAWKFPFASSTGGIRNRLAGNQGTPLDFIRQHGDYLLPNGFSSLSLLGVVLRNMTLSVSVYLTLLVSILILFSFTFEQRDWLLPYWPKASWFAQALIMLTFLFGLSSFIYAWSTRLVLGTEQLGYKMRVWFQQFQGSVLVVAIGCGLLALLPMIDDLIRQKLQHMTYMTSSFPALMGVIGAIYEFFQNQKGNKASKGMLTEARILLTSLILIFGILIISYKISVDIQSLPKELPYFFLIVIMGVVLFSGLFINLNLFGIGRMDRDRLMEAFLPNPEAIDNNQWGIATEADVAYLKDISGADQWGPYHLINTNLVLVDSDQAKFRGRGGDNFIMSPCYCGGDAIGFHKMADFQGGKMTLATAVSISGAALNPNAANSGQGATRNRLVSFILSFLNLRLGYWVMNPIADPWRQKIAQWTKPNFYYPGLIQGLFGHELNEKAGYLELTDGGHFDNTGLYEFIRRRVDIIYFSSAGADPDFTLDDVGSVLIRIKVDFGATIKFGDELESLMPGTDDKSAYGRRFLFSESGFAVGEIHYPLSNLGPAKIGKILMVRAALAKDLPTQIYSYSAQHNEFPNQSTSDQFFDETQLESYRELGLDLTDKLCTSFP